MALPHCGQKRRQLFFRLPRQVEPAHDGEDPVFSRELPGLLDGVDDTGMGATGNNDQPPAFEQHNDGGIIFEIIALY